MKPDSIDTEVWAAIQADRSFGHLAWKIVGGVRTEFYQLQGAYGDDIYSAPYFNAIDVRNGYRQGRYWGRPHNLTALDSFPDA